jgi:shikimate kinase
LVLVGARGAGKSTVGSELARRLGIAFADLDARIEQATGASVEEIFVRGGEAEFRRLETAALAELARTGPTVIATGGGAVVRARNRALLRELGTVVWLRVSPEVAVARTAGAPGRPALTELAPLEEAWAIARQRQQWYEEVADHTLETDGRVSAEVCDELEQLWHDLARDDVR